MKNKKVSFTGFKSLMLSVHTAETKLIDKLEVHRAKHMHLSVKDYVDEWIAFGLSIPKAGGKEYSAKWLADIARAAGLKQRAVGGGRKPTAPRTPQEKQQQAFEKWLAATPDKLTSAQRRAVLKRIK